MSNKSEISKFDKTIVKKVIEVLPQFDDKLQDVRDLFPRIPQYIESHAYNTRGYYAYNIFCWGIIVGMGVLTGANKLEKQQKEKRNK